jgi:site-specific recombinase XerD
VFGTGLDRFCKFVEKRYRLAEGAPASALRLEYVVAFARALGETSPALAPASRQNYVLAVRRFYRYLVRERVLELDASDFENLDDVLKRIALRRDALKRMDRRQTESRAATADVVAALLVAARTCEEDVPATAPEGDRKRAALRQLRNEALIRALYSTGMRIGEALALVRGDLDARRQSARVAGRNKPDRTVYFSKDAWHALARYLEMRGSMGGVCGRVGVRGCESVGMREGAREEPVFARHDRGAGNPATNARRFKRLTRQRVEQLFEEWRSASGIEEHVTPHGLRQGRQTYPPAPS